MVFRGGEWTEVLSKDLLVGDIVRVTESVRACLAFSDDCSPLACMLFRAPCRSIPAHLFLLGSGIENGTHCFIDTKDLDG